MPMKRRPGKEADSLVVMTWKLQDVTVAIWTMVVVTRMAWYSTWMTQSEKGDVVAEVQRGVGAEMGNEAVILDENN